MITEYGEIAGMYGTPKVVIDAGQHIVFVCKTTTGWRVARLPKRAYCTDCIDACDDCLGPIEFSDRMELLQYVAGAEHASMSEVRDAYEYVVDSGWITMSKQPKAHRVLWTHLAALDLGVGLEDVSELYQLVVDTTTTVHEGEIVDEEELTVSDAYAGDKGTLMITGSREAVSRVMDTLRAVAQQQ